MPQSKTAATRGTPPTIVDVAKRAGVATSTASRAFNHPRLLKEETVSRVRNAADEIGYHRNRNARALSTGRPAALGLIVPDLSNPFFPPLVHAAQVQAESKGYSLYILSSEHDIDREKHLASLVSFDVAGLILASPRMQESSVRAMAQKVHVVLINAQVEELPRVLVSASSGITRAIETAAQQGIEKVTYIGGEEQWWPNAEREVTARAEAERHKMGYRHLTLTQPTYSKARGLGESIDCSADELLIGFDDIVAHGLMAGLERAGRRPPGDFRILGCDDALPISTTPELATVHLNTRRAGPAAVDLLLASDEGGEAEEIRIDGTYQPGETL